MKMKNRLQGGADINAGNYHTNVFQENEPNVKRILGIYHKGKLQKEIIKEDGLIGMVNWA